MARRIQVGEHKYTELSLRFYDKYRFDPELNAGRAYRETFPNCKTAASSWQSASRLLSSVKGVAYFNFRALEEMTEVGVKPTVERIVDELKKAAFLDPLYLFDDDHRLKEMTELPEHIRRAIGGIEVKRTVGKGDDPDIWDIIKIKLISKEKTLELLGKHLVMFTEKFMIESEEAMYQRVRAEMIAAGEEELSMIMANTRRMRAIRLDTGPQDDSRGPEKPVDKTSFEYLGSMM